MRAGFDMLRASPNVSEGLGFRVNYFTEMCSGSEAGSYLRLIDSCSTQLKAQGPFRSCNESKEEEDLGGGPSGRGRPGALRGRERQCFEPRERSL